jgi:hypothetical protein
MCVLYETERRMENKKNFMSMFSVRIFGRKEKKKKKNEGQQTVLRKVKLRRVIFSSKGQSMSSYTSSICSDHTPLYDFKKD